MLLNHSPLRALDEPDQHIYIFPSILLRLQLFESLRSVKFRRQQQFVRMMNLANPFLAEPTPLQTDCVHAIRVSVASRRGFREWQNIACDGRAPADKRIRADTHKVMHRTQLPYR